MQTIGIIGLGYVGLPLAVAFGKKIKTIGFDLNSNRIRQLKLSNDITLEVSKKEIIRSKYLNFTSDVNNLKKCNYFKDILLLILKFLHLIKSHIIFINL